MTVTTRSPALTAAGTRAGGRRLSRLGLPAAVLAGVLVTWEVVTRLGVVQEFLLPSPGQVFGTLAEFVTGILTGEEIAGHFFTTFSEIVVGFGISIVLGVLVATLMSEFRLIADGLYPYVVAFDSTPKVAIAPLFIIWFGFGQLSKIVMVVTIAIFPIIITTLAGLRATDSQTLRLMRSLGASRWHTFTKVRARNALPFFFAGLELAIAGASVGAVVGEFSGGNQGLGYVTLRAQEVFDLSEAFAAIILLAVQGVILHRLVILLRRRVVFWDVPGRRQ